MSKWHGGKGSKQRPTDMKKYGDNWDTIFGKDQKTKQKSMTELNWDGDEEVPDGRWNWWGEGEENDSFEDQCREIYGDSMPDEKDLEEIVDRELKKLNKDFPETLKSLGEMSTLVIVFFFSILALTPTATADDNHVHIEQLDGGDNLSIAVDQVGYDNLAKFTLSHANNTVNIEQIGSGNTVSWISYWGSGKGWGGDLDGTNNTLNIEQVGGSTIGFHILGNHNDLDISQNGTHLNNVDIHVDYVDHNVSQSGTGSHTATTYYYQANASEGNFTQSGSGSHTATVTLQGNQPTTINLQQLGSTNQTYSLTQNCYTSGGCTVSVTQGN